MFRAPFPSWLAAALVLCAGLLAGCALPSQENRSVTHALDADQARDTPLGRAIAPLADQHPGDAGIHALAQAQDAFAARMLLAHAATRTLDVQYYIWHGDMTGTMLLEALHLAADRGVRVRLLLDDNGTSGLDAVLAALAEHPHIEVRLFNPFVVRRPKFIGYLTDFSRLNRRMHNKSFTADNQATIIGGRNIGDEYFGATDDVLFADLDVLAIGPVVHDVSADFDRYWNSESAYPVERLVPAAAPDALERLAREAGAIQADPRASAYALALRDSAFIRKLMASELEFEWAPTRMVSDDPAKVLDRAPPEASVAHQLENIIGVPETVLDLVSPYFVPTESGTRALGEIAQRGVKVRVLTNALEATDVAVVHSGYAKRRRDLLKAGIELWEMRAGANEPERSKGLGPFGSSGSSLHAKTFAVDDRRVFVGSFNFDPRSANLNTELGFVIDSPLLARRIDEVFLEGIPRTAYRVCLDERDRLYWLEQRDGKTLRHDTEPGTTWWQRTSVWFISLLPIEHLL
ncbi:hypothetical protein CEG14_21565 [Bordetella genomosp. 1]|uniref:PLD phosphodiesterase domain-containing protein n=1 Tax=Bordetella genomosp. 1 TaxID=1395607 RepID=A0A261RY60_9BORD|nr:phospholipase D family protein [Bordetella genomosp. 1]OZI29213.1 hypothetical protein CEG14_21565 [Bordetella genomosp. 1]